MPATIPPLTVPVHVELVGEESKSVANQAARWWAWRVALISVATEAFLSVYPLLADALDGHDPVAWGGLGRSVVKVAMSSVLAWLARRLVAPPPVLAPVAVADAAVAAGAPLNAVLPATSAALDELAAGAVTKVAKKAPARKRS